MIPDPTKNEVDELIARQEEVERLRNQLYVVPVPTFHKPCSENISYLWTWKDWRPLEEK